jgi:hypothetical protein
MFKKSTKETKPIKKETDATQEELMDEKLSEVSAGCHEKTNSTGPTFPRRPRFPLPVS